MSVCGSSNFNFSLMFFFRNFSPRPISKISKNFSPTSISKVHDTLDFCTPHFASYGFFFFFFSIEKGFHAVWTRSVEKKL